MVFETTWPALFENYRAAGNDLGGAVPGGQPFLFHGMYVENVTGLGITKNRIYDPRSASWLSEDPLDDADSPNIYGFVAMRPHEMTDPLGLQRTPYPCGMRPCDPNEQTGGEWLGENVLGPAFAAYEGAWDWFLKKTGGNYANREFVEIASGLGFFRGLRAWSAARYGAQRVLSATGKVLDRIPVNAEGFSPSAFGVGNLQREEKAAGQVAQRIGQRALPATEDFPWAKYQRHVTGVDYEETWLLSQKKLGVDASTAGYTVEAKWAGKNAAAWRSSPYNPSSELYDETKILDQARRLLELNKQTSGKGVRYALSNEPSARHFTELFEKIFPEEMKAGTLKVWEVPGTGM
jgi:RHS repeat-associated protein